MTKTYIATFTDTVNNRNVTKKYADVTEERAKELAERYASFTQFTLVSVQAAA